MSTAQCRSRIEELVWEVRWGRILLGLVRRDRLDVGFIPTRRRRGQVTVLSLIAAADD